MFYAEDLPEAGADLLGTHGADGENWKDFDCSSLILGQTENRTMSAAAAPVASSYACLAKKYNVTLVVGGPADKKPCAQRLNIQGKPYPCDSATNLSAYNTQLAYGPNGKILAKYHKIHLANLWSKLYEPHWSAADPLEKPVTFTSDFGVKFGMFICHDLDFGSPALGLLREGVRDFLYSTLYVNQNVYLNAVSTQDGFSRSHGVNLLAANSPQNGRGSSGSGIWPADTSATFQQHYNKLPGWPSTQCSPTDQENCNGWVGIVKITSPDPTSAQIPSSEFTQ